MNKKLLEKSKSNCLSNRQSECFPNSKCGACAVPLTALMPCQKGKIASIHDCVKVTQRLSDLGLIQGTLISFLRSAPLKGPVQICVRNSTLAIDRSIAEKILVFVVGQKNGKR